jgi:OOP family OmpA-OmpF porin
MIARVYHAGSIPAALLVAAWCGVRGADAASMEVPSKGAGSISQAMIQAGAGDTIWVRDGVYRENEFIKAGVTVAARNLHKATINGRGRRIAVSLSKHSGIAGMKITNGTIGVFSADDGNSVRNCLISGNWMTGLMCVGHLPAIEDNIIVFNRGSGIQGWDVRSVVNSINHNTIAFNSNHGIAVGGESILIIENNIIAWNERFGIKVKEKAMRDIRIMSNNLFGNLTMHAELPPGNFMANPMFVSPRKKMDFNLDRQSSCIAKASDGSNLGARITF